MQPDEHDDILDRVAALPVNERVALVDAALATLPLHEQANVIETVKRRLRKPRDLRCDELDDGYRRMQAGLRAASDPGERELLAKTLYDLDFERRRRERQKWLGHQPPEARDFPAGLGESEDYPRWWMARLA